MNINTNSEKFFVWYINLILFDQVIMRYEEKAADFEHHFTHMSDKSLIIDNITDFPFYAYQYITQRTNVTTQKNVLQDFIITNMYNIKLTFNF